MSSLLNSKTPSSFARAAQGCGALVLAGAMVFPMSPALAQNVTAEAPAAVAAGSLPANPTPKAGGDQKAETNAFTPHWSYSALTDTSKDQDLHFNGWDFNGDINSPKGVQILIREKGSNTPVLAISDIVEYNDPEYAFQYQHGYLIGNVKIPANTLDSAKQYTVEVWGNNGYEGSDKLVTPVVGQAPEGRGTLLAWQDLNFKGSDGVQAANLPTAQDNDKKPEPKPDPKPVEQTTTFEASVPDGYKYDGVNPFLITTEGGTVHVKGSGYTKEWREKHGKVVVYIVASQGVPDGADVLPANDVLLRFEEGKDFTIAENGVLDAQLTVKPDALQSYYKPRAPFLGIPRYEKRYEVSYEIGMFTEMQGEPQLTVEDLQAGKNVLYRTVLDTQAFRSSAFAPKVEYKALGDTAADQSIYFLGTGFYGKFASSGGVQYVIREKGSNTPVLATSDIFWYNRYPHFSEFENGEVRGVVKVPASTLDPAKKYVVEVWSNDGYKNGEFAGPVVGKAPEGRSTLLASQDLNFKGSDATEGKQPSLTDEQRKERATRGELTAALYAQAGSPKVDLPETSPWPDVKTTDPNYAAYIWARQKGITFGWADGKFHADAGISNATVAAFTYRAAGSPTVQYWSPYTDVAPGSAFFREIAWAGQNKVALSTSGTFNPKHMVTRGELEVLMMAF